MIKIKAPTKNKLLNEYIQKFYEATFVLEDLYKDTYDYYARLRHFENKYVKKIRMLRNSLKVEIMSDVNFKNDLIKYLKTSQDFLFFTNAFASAPDQRKFDSSGTLIPFVAFFYQVIFWEISNYLSVAVKKPRDMGISFTQYCGHAMQLVLNVKKECVFLSENEKKVDSIGDLTQTALGRIRYLINNEYSIFSLDSFFVNKYLNLYSTKNCGIVGKAMTSSATNQMRANKIILDEAGLIKQLNDLKKEMQMTAKCITYMGTLKPASDIGFREILKASRIINHRQIWEEFKELIQHKTYRETWEIIIERIKSEIETGETVRIDLKYFDHPLKAHEGNYYKIECERLFNDEIAIAHQLDADLDAGSPDRSFYNMYNDNFITEEEFEVILKYTKGFKLIAGFDPGSKTATFVPAFIDNDRRMFVFPAVQFKKGTGKDFIQKLIDEYVIKYNRTMVIYAEESVMSYEGVGFGWTAELRKFEKYLQLVVVSNHKVDVQLLVTNRAFSLKSYNPIFKKEMKNVLVTDTNKADYMNYVSGLKYSDLTQKKISHKCEALIAMIYNEYRDEIENQEFMYK